LLVLDGWKYKPHNSLLNKSAQGLARKGQESQVPGPLNRPGEFTLVFGTGASLSAGMNFSMI
jgi:hypothetical protein